MNSTSYGLFRLTRQQGWFSNAQIVLPKHWDMSQCQPGRDIQSNQSPAPYNADINIGEKFSPSVHGTVLIWNVSSRLHDCGTGQFSEGAVHK